MSDTVFVAQAMWGAYDDSTRAVVCASVDIKMCRCALAAFIYPLDEGFRSKWIEEYHDGVFLKQYELEEKDDA